MPSATPPPLPAVSSTSPGSPSGEPSSRGAAGRWGGREVELPAYFQRIRHKGDARADIETLRALHRLHVAAIPFENVDVLLGRPVSLDVQALQDKLVSKARGGYCYEHNLLFAAVLERVGFSVVGLEGRIRMGSDKLRPATHMLLAVEAAGALWLCDVGFGGEGLLEPLPLRAGTTAEQGAWTYGLVQEDDQTWVLRSLRPEGWFDLYSFTLSKRFPVDYAVLNHYMTTHPKSPFASRLVVQQTTPHVRRGLLETTLSVREAGRPAVERPLAAADLPAAIHAHFGIDLTAADAVALAERATPS